jgi:hypothetical protein
MKRRSPLVSDDANELLDHLEICALTDADANASASQLKTDVEITGSDDAVDAEEQEAPTLSAHLEGKIDAAFTEAELRIRACGVSNYPFDLQRKVLLPLDKGFSSVYTFLLGLSAFGEDAVPEQNGAKLFEEVCAHASQIYFGCEHQPAEAHVFGFPRRIGPKDFRKALTDLCERRICEGTPDKKMPNVRTKKDASLDIVIWRGFPDARSSKFIAFGQCATGKHWWGKRHELQPADWCRAWMTKGPHVTPTKMFFVPHAVSDELWCELGYIAGIIFDRFRITHYGAQGLPVTLRRELQRWSKAAFTAKATSSLAE